MLMQISIETTNSNYKKDVLLKRAQPKYANYFNSLSAKTQLYKTWPKKQPNDKPVATEPVGTVKRRPVAMEVVSEYVLPKYRYRKFDG